MPRGRPRKPTLQVIREGNPGHRPIRDEVVLPPSELLEPDWPQTFPGTSAEARRARSIAAELWRRVAPTLHRSVGLVDAQRECLVDYCVAWARIDQCERAVSRDGMTIPAGRSDRGRIRNPHTTVLNQYRPHFRSLAAELGLTPASASRMSRPSTDPDEDDPFDPA